jgi:hypothetical protein
VWSGVDPGERCPDELRHGRVGDPRRVQQHHLIARVDKRLKHLKQRLLPAGRDKNVFGSAVDAVGLVTLCDCGSELRDPFRRGVASFSGRECLSGGLFDILGRIEVGFADAEVGDVDAVGLKRSGLVADRHRGARCDALHAVGSAVRLLWVVCRHLDLVSSASSSVVSIWMALSTAFAP